jgi:hypothetical protein
MSFAPTTIKLVLQSKPPSRAGAAQPQTVAHAKEEYGAAVSEGKSEMSVCCGYDRGRPQVGAVTDRTAVTTPRAGPRVRESRAVGPLASSSTNDIAGSRVPPVGRAFESGSARGWYSSLGGLRARSSERGIFRKGSCHREWQGVRESGPEHPHRQGERAARRAREGNGKDCQRAPSPHDLPFPMRTTTSRYPHNSFRVPRDGARRELPPRPQTISS